MATIKELLQSPEVRSNKTTTNSKHTSPAVLNSSEISDQKLPLKLQSLIKGLHTSAIIMVFISLLSIWFSPWAIFYIILARELNPKKVPSRNIIKGAAIATLPLCLGLIPIIIDVEFWNMNKLLLEYEEHGSKAFIPDKEFLAGEPRRKKSRVIAWSILLSAIAIIIFFIIYAVATSTPTPSTSTSTEPSALSTEKSEIDSLKNTYDICLQDLGTMKSSLNQYSQESVDSYNSKLASCKAERDQINSKVSDYNSKLSNQ